MIPFTVLCSVVEQILENAWRNLVLEPCKLFHKPEMIAIEL